MKTLYCLGAAPQFRVPCIKYGFIINEKENEVKNYVTKSNSINKKFYDNEKGEKESIIDKWMENYNPNKSIKKCLQINPNIKLQMRQFYRHLKESLSIERNKTSNNIKNNENGIEKSNSENNKSPYINYNNDGNKLRNLKFIFDRNNYKFTGSINENIYNKKYNKTNNYFKKQENILIQTQAPIKHSRNYRKISQNDLSVKFVNYNYPIQNESISQDFCQSLMSKYKAKLSTQIFSVSNNNNNSITNTSNSRIIFNSKFLNNFENNRTINENSKSEIKKNKNFVNELNNTSYKKKNNKLKIKKFKFNSIDNVIKKRRKAREHAQNKLNILYSENEEHFYRKYDKHRKKKFLNGLCLTHVNCSPKEVLNQLNEKISSIKTKVGVVKSIVDKTFPRILADISETKKEVMKSQRKEGYNSPYIERLNKIKKAQQNMDIYFTSPVEIINKNRKIFKKINKKKV